ncbi:MULTISPECIES: hypothetical protein [Streptomycetaceae]|uniref:hypothetical protein n=1 Tax=Streptomycetaceae TaxID=2062 RepID=UPI00093AE564|nr:MULTISPECIES: hypothetical protein [Streptomycetaceae]MDQ0310739.1 hypothetical protein [Kitasatospora herbaricolor]OKI19385.1 hypothetical protein A6A07_07830 [Streptomyces sp. CB03911]GGV33065.1 hypothetical protein GCM10010495_57250 [Kitasatospora herbaricolor]
MSQPANNANQSPLVSRSTANPRRTTLASVADFAQLPGARRPEDVVTYSTDLPTSTANPRRTILQVAPAVAVPQA